MSGPVEPAEPLAAHAAWRAARERRLRAPDGWPGVIGLHWFERGDNEVGSAATAVPLPSGPACLGTLRWDGAALTWLPAAGPAQPLLSDRDGAPTLLRCGAIEFFVIERDGRPAVRVRDLDWAVRRPFAGLRCHAYDPAWRFDAVWRRGAGGWEALFHVGEREVRLQPQRVDADGVMFVFRDATSGAETYGAGRFLDAAPAVDGRLALDFNYAYNPPCAFTAHATCPLPPASNRLPFAVAAGELAYTG